MAWLLFCMLSLQLHDMMVAGATFITVARHPLAEDVVAPRGAPRRGADAGKRGHGGCVSPTDRCRSVVSAAWTATAEGEVKDLHGEGCALVQLSG